MQKHATVVRPLICIGLCLLGLLTGGPLLAQAQTPPVTRLTVDETSLPTLSVTVEHEPLLLSDLQSLEFALNDRADDFDDPVLQETTPIQVAVLLDWFAMFTGADGVTYEFTDVLFRRIVDSLLLLTTESADEWAPERDRMAIYSAGPGPRDLITGQDWTHDLNEVSAYLSNLTRDQITIETNESYLNNLLHATIQRVAEASPSAARKVVVLYSNGRDQGSDLQLPAVHELASTHGVELFVVNFAPPPGEPTYHGTLHLDALASAFSGQRWDLIEAGTLEPVWRDVLTSRVRSQFAVTVNQLDTWQPTLRVGEQRAPLSMSPVDAVWLSPTGDSPLITSTVPVTVAFAWPKYYPPLQPDLFQVRLDDGEFEPLPADTTRVEGNMLRFDWSLSEAHTDATSHSLQLRSATNGPAIEPDTTNFTRAAPSEEPDELFPLPPVISKWLLDLSSRLEEIDQRLGRGLRASYALQVATLLFTVTVLAIGAGFMLLIWYSTREIRRQLGDLSRESGDRQSEQKQRQQLAQTAAAPDHLVGRLCWLQGDHVRRRIDLWSQPTYFGRDQSALPLHTYRFEELPHPDVAAYQFQIWVEGHELKLGNANPEIIDIGDKDQLLDGHQATYVNDDFVIHGHPKTLYTGNVIRVGEVKYQVFLVEHRVGYLVGDNGFVHRNGMHKPNGNGQPEANGPSRHRQPEVEERTAAAIVEQDAPQRTAPEQPVPAAVQAASTLPATAPPAPTPAPRQPAESEKPEAARAETPPAPETVPVEPDTVVETETVRQQEDSQSARAAAEAASAQAGAAETGEEEEETKELPAVDTTATGNA